jgi:GNAT superfamily N-acetyltransferase
MNVRITEEPAAALSDYARISIAFEVDRILEVPEQAGDGAGFALIERPLVTPYRKDYDAIAGNHPRDWPRRFDLSKWGAFAARIDAVRVGGALVAHDAADVALLERRTDLALLWDLRVSPQQRRSGIGSALLGAAEPWSIACGCRQLVVETQNTNVVACRFYASRGFALKTLRRLAYPELPDEIQLLWYKDL